MIYRIKVISVGCVPLDGIRAHAAYATSLGLPLISPQPPHGRPLAVVGGGQSGADALDELRTWPGNIWAINGTCSWLARNGVRSTLFSVDPEACLADLLDGVEDAILSSICHPSAFDALAGRVRIFHPEHVAGEHGFLGGTTSATRVPTVALCLGYQSISFFGCEGSFAETTHTFKDEAPARQVLVLAGGEHYRTTLQFMNQSESLAAIIAAFPDVLKDRSGGLLGAMLAYPETWEVVGLTATLKAELDPGAPLVPVE